ncbi:MAG: hypothetical protein K2G40_05925, partial [Muribaculaceae bacterium]|nr:hypothetical protein [Muribaculaceae bacterium]
MKILYCEPKELLAPGLSSSVSLLTDSSLTRNGHALFLPPHHERWTLTVAPALHISRLGKFIATKFAHRYYDAWTLTARLRPDGITYPASATEVAFDSSMITGEWMPLDPTDKTEIEVNITGTTEFILKLDLKYFNETISGLSGSFIMKHGDVIVPRPQLVAFPVIPDTKLALACDGK